MKMKVFMRAQGGWDAIEPSDPVELVSERKDKFASAAIYQAVPKATLLLLAEKDTAKEAWKILKMMNQGVDHVKDVEVQTLKSGALDDSHEGSRIC